jgi:tripartite-type tricarboxylate transporter receptor subunit TctC
MAQSASTNFPDKPIRIVVGYGLGGDTKEQISDYSDAEII